jgi:DNA-binding transcriptional MocR family regulator
VAAGEGFYLNPADGEHNLRIAFSFAAPEDIEAGIKLLGQVIERLKLTERA